jgi:flagellar biosynthesis protein
MAKSELILTTDPNASLVPAPSGRDLAIKPKAAPKVEHVLAPTSTGYTPEQIIAIARLHGIPLRGDPAITNILSHGDVSEQTPPELCKLVAEILLWAHKMEQSSNKRHKNRRKPPEKRAA